MAGFARKLEPGGKFSLEKRAFTAHRLAMKLAPLIGLLLLPLSVFGQDTAYQALKTLRLLGEERSETILKNVVEVRGRSGAPQPEFWTIIVDDPRARGGIREFEIARGRIRSERTPINAYSGVSEGVAMNFQKLNIDSDGAFQLAEQEARKAKISFDAVDYVLRRDGDDGAPLWVLFLLDTAQRGVGTVEIAAETGDVVLRNFGSASPNTGKKSSPGRTISVSPRDRDHQATEEPRQHLGRRIERRFRRIGGSLQEFFTGRRTVDREYRD